jgi:hypothetical protein
MPERYAESQGMPRRVRAASALTLLLAVYAAVTAGPGCIAGLFVGPHILIPAIVFAALAPVLLVSWRGLEHRRRWARWPLIVLSAVAAPVLTITLVRASIAKETDLATATPWLLIVVCCVVIARNLAASSASLWCTK